MELEEGKPRYQTITSISNIVALTNYVEFFCCKVLRSLIKCTPPNQQVKQTLHAYLLYTYTHHKGRKLGQHFLFSHTNAI